MLFTIIANTYICDIKIFVCEKARISENNIYCCNLAIRLAMTFMIDKSFSCEAVAIVNETVWTPAINKCMLIL